MARYFLNHETMEDYFQASQDQMTLLIDLIGNLRMVSLDFRKLQFEYQTLLKNFGRIFDLKRKSSKDIRPISEIFEFHLKKECVVSINEIFDGDSFEIKAIKKKHYGI